MATKLVKEVTYHEGLPPIKSHDFLITWSCLITWQIKKISTTGVPMATKLGWMVTYLNGLLTIKGHDHLVMWSCKIMWQAKNILSSLPLPVATLAWEASTIKLHDTLITWPCEIMWQNKSITSLLPMATKHYRMVTYCNGLLTIKSYDPLNMWSCWITRQTKTIIYPIPQCLWLPNWTGWYLNLSGPHPQSYLILCLRGLVR